MNFIDYYKSIKNIIERRDLRNKIMYECGAQLPTFYSWVRRKRFPKLVKQKIAEIVQKEESELFPEKQE